MAESSLELGEPALNEGGAHRKNGDDALSIALGYLYNTHARHCKLNTAMYYVHAVLSIF